MGAQGQGKRWPAGHVYSWPQSSLISLLADLMGRFGPGDRAGPRGSLMKEQSLVRSTLPTKARFLSGVCDTYTCTHMHRTDAHPRRLHTCAHTCTHTCKQMHICTEQTHTHVGRTHTHTQIHTPRIPVKNTSQICRLSILSLSFSCVTSSKSYNLSGPQFSHQKTRDNNIYLQGYFENN